MTLSHWQATIFGLPNTSIQDRDYFLKLECPENYPNVPPRIRFVTKINMPGVDAHGNVGPSIVQNWNRNSTMAQALVQIRNAMKACTRLQQPPPGATY